MSARSIPLFPKKLLVASFNNITDCGSQHKIRTPANGTFTTRQQIQLSANSIQFHHIGS